MLCLLSIIGARIKLQFSKVFFSEFTLIINVYAREYAPQNMQIRMEMYVESFVYLSGKLWLYVHFM